MNIYVITSGWYWMEHICFWCSRC